MFNSINYSFKNKTFIHFLNFVRNAFKLTYMLYVSCLCDRTLFDY